mgnify:CR=1 FL=1
MLTKNDLQQIKAIVKTEVNGAIQSQVPPIVTGILQKELKPVKKDLKKIRRDLEFAVGVLDRDGWKVEKRVEVLEHQAQVV